jgi:hypothetical protein
MIIFQNLTTSHGSLNEVDDA